LKLIMRSGLLSCSFLALGFVTFALANVVNRKVPWSNYLRITGDGDRIVGGDEVDEHSIPWQVALVVPGGTYPFCGGTIVSATKILTAAHCEYSSAEVMVAEHNTESSLDGVRHTVKNWAVHPDYNSNTLDSDFAVLTLDKAIDLGDKAQAACLPKTELEVGAELTVSGWGTLSAGGSSPNVLHAVKVPYISNEACDEAYSYYTSYNITSNMMCAGDVENGGIDSCQGDSGGPLTSDNTIVGVVSWGIGCADAGNPGVYAKVLSQLDWLAKQGVTNTCEDSGDEDGEDDILALIIQVVQSKKYIVTKIDDGECMDLENTNWCEKKVLNRGLCEEHSLNGVHGQLLCQQTCGHC